MLNRWEKVTNPKEDRVQGKSRNLGGDQDLDLANILGDPEVDLGQEIVQGGNVHIVIAIDPNQPRENHLQTRNHHLEEKDRDLEGKLGRGNLGLVQRKESREGKDILLHLQKHLHSVMPVDLGTTAGGKEGIQMYRVLQESIEKDPDPKTILICYISPVKYSWCLTTLKVKAYNRY